MFSGQVANGSQSKKSGSLFLVAFYMNGFKLGNKEVSLKNCLRRLSNIMPEKDIFIGDGNRLTV